MTKATYQISGMTCASCASSLESYLKPISGVEEVQVNYANKSMRISFDESLISIQEINKKAKEISYEIDLPEEGSSSISFEEKEKFRFETLRKKLIIACIFSIPIFVISMFLSGKIPNENYLLAVLSLPVIIYSGSEFYKIAWKRLQQGKSNMDTLVALSTGIAFLYSLINTFFPNLLSADGLTTHVYFESAVVIITLILLGRYLEERAKSQTSESIKKLMDLQPKTAKVIRDEKELTLPIEDIIHGDILFIRPGERIPVDGKVEIGSTYVDESMLSGEPLAVKKENGDSVFAGTLNQNGAIRFKATQIGSDTLLSKIIDQVQEALGSKPQIQKTVDYIAGIFVPVVIILSLITFFLWYFLGPNPSLTPALVAMITVLIIACPCALGLATPTALLVGIGEGADHGILIKNAEVLEIAHRADVLVIDKTGTLTEGKPQVTEMIWLDDKQNKSKLLSILYHLESGSEHPLAQAVKDYVFSDTLEEIEIDKFESVTGKGVQGSVDSKMYFIGNKKLIKGIPAYRDQEAHEKLKEVEKSGKTAVYFSSEKSMIAIIGIEDPLKSNAKSVVESISSLGIQTYMLTGDNAYTAERISNELGINHYKASLLPADKGDFIKNLQKEGKCVLMAGDGINDSYALAQADIGIAMASGSDIAIESASITILHSDLELIPKAIELSKKTFQTIKQNLFWAFIYNLIAIPIAAGVLYPTFGFLLNPMIAGGAMALSSVSVVGNSLRLRKKLNWK